MASPFGSSRLRDLRQNADALCRTAHSAQLGFLPENGKHREAINRQR
ncbi:hypothetical protein [Agrobacterium sp.]